MKADLAKIINHSLSDVENMRGYGMISDRLAESFMAVWEWSAPRMSGRTGLKHDAYWNRFGKVAYYRRIEKVRAAFGFEPLKYPENFWTFEVKTGGAK